MHQDSYTHPARVHVSDISQDNLRKEIQEGLEFIRFQHIVDADSTVFVKPNLTDRVHTFGITTTPLMIRTIIEIISPFVKRVFVGESDGGNYAFSADASLRNHGVYDAAESLSNVEVVNLSKLPRTRISANVCGKNVWVELPDLLLDHNDCLISVPVFKTHAMTHGTFSLKNLWGCYPDPMRLLHHKDLDFKLALINKLLKNRIQIIDGFWSLDGHGPMEGTPVATNKMLIADNPVAADATAAYLMNLDATKIGPVRVAEEFGLGTADLRGVHFNRPIQAERFTNFKPYKVTLDQLNALTWRSELLGRIVYASPLTPPIYRLVNTFRPRDKHTFWAEHNKTLYER